MIGCIMDVKVLLIGYLCKIYKMSLIKVFDFLFILIMFFWKLWRYNVIGLNLV